MRVLPPILANICLIASALGFGNLLRSLFPRSFSPIDRIAFTLLGGMGILGTLLFCVGQVWFSRTMILVILLGGISLSIKPLLGAVRDSGSLLAKMRPPVLPLAIISLGLVVTLVGGLALPVGDMNNDSIAYHYLGPTVWLRHGEIRAVPDEVLTYFPVLVETQYAALMSIGGQRAPGFFSVISFVVLLLMAAALAMRLRLDQPGVWWALAVIVAMPAAYRGVYGGMLDAVFAGFVLAATRVAFDAERGKDFALLGIFCGFAMGTKYTGIVAFVMVIVCLFLVAAWASRKVPGSMLKHLGVTVAIAAAVASPFYLRNWMLYGCPIYPPPPGLLRFFPSTQILPGVMKELLANVRDTGRGMGSSLLDLLVLPYNLTYHTANFRGAGGIGLVPFAVGPMGLLYMRRDSFAIGLALFAILQTIAWFLTAQVSRYMIPVYVIGAIFGVIGWQYAARVAPRYGRALAGLAVAISILYGMFMIVADRKDDVHAGLSNSFEDRRRHETIPRIESFDFINRKPSVKRILVLNLGIATYFIEKDSVKPFGRWGEQTLEGAQTVSQVMAQLPNLHVTHILDVKSESGAFDLPENPLGMRKVFEGKDERIYNLE